MVPPNILAAARLGPRDELWYVERLEFIGRLTIRYRLTAALRQVGGHIGYDVRPTARRQGHATEMLKQGLPFAAALLFDPALLTCDIAVSTG
jgi:predicted acetyltransferase